MVQTSLGKHSFILNLIDDPIPRLIWRIAAPASVGFFFNTMYNVVDTLFAGLVSTEGLAALSLCFPVFFIVLAMGSGVAQGGTALMANAHGAGQGGQAHHIFFQCLSFGCFVSLVLTFVGLGLAPSLFEILGAEGDYLELTMDYMSVIMSCTVFFILQAILNAALNAKGDTRTYRDVLIVGFFLNCVLDPWFMYGGAGLPAMGLKGIALATVLIQIAGCGYLLWRVSQLDIWEGDRLANLRPTRTYLEIARQGIPASLNMMTVAIGIFVITFFISKFSKEGVAAYGVATRIEQIVLLPTIGLNIAVLSLVGQNNGAKRLDRVKAIWLTAMKWGSLMMLVSGGLVFMAGRSLMTLFTADEQVVQTGYEYLRIASITLCSYVILFQTVAMLQGVKRPAYAIWIGIYRQIVAPCLFFYLFAFVMAWNLDGIWWGIFTVTWSAALLTLWYGRRTLRNLMESEEGDSVGG